MRFYLIISFLFVYCIGIAQTNAMQLDVYKPNAEKEAKYLPYLAVRHGGFASIETWKKNNTVQYYKELWYFCESFYIKRNYLSEGVLLDESAIDITRFESQRKENEEVFIVMPGSKDAIVLLPNNKLIYKAEF